MKAEGRPRSSVEESRREAANVAAAPSTIKPASASAAGSPAGARKRPMRAIIIGKRPLQGMNTLVRMAMRRSRGLSMMRQPTTAAAVQPSPCLLYTSRCV